MTKTMMAAAKVEMEEMAVEAAKTSPRMLLLLYKAALRKASSKRDSHPLQLVCPPLSTQKVSFRRFIFLNNISLVKIMLAPSIMK